MDLSQISSSDAIGFCLVLARVQAMFLTLPKLATDRYHLIFRILFGVVLALVIAPMVIRETSVKPIDGPFDFMMLLIGEVGIGLSLGLAASCVVIGLLAAGQIVSQLLGFQIGSLQQGLGPDQNSDYRKLFFAIGLFSWFAISGHRFAVEGLLASFANFPVGGFHFSGEQLELLNHLIQVTLGFAIRFSLPVAIVAVFGFLIAGFFSRVLGSGQSTGVAFGLNQILFFVIAIPLVLAFSNETYQQTTGQIEQFISSLTQVDWNKVN